MTENHRLTYLCAEGLRDGTAANTHVKAVAGELEQRDYLIKILANSSANYTSAGLLSRLVRYGYITVAGIWARRNCRIFYLRAHFALAPAAAILSLSGAKIIVEVNGLAEDMITTHKFLKPFTGGIKFAERLLLNSANSIVAVTSELSDQVKKISSTKQVVTIPNGVHTERFTPQTKAKPAYAIFFGSLTAWHGVQTLLDALDHSDWPSDLILKIAGEGQFQEKIEACKNPLCDYLGPIQHSDMPEKIAGASIGLSPIELPEKRGLKEVFPLKLLEMLAAGVPVVASDVTGQREIVLKNNVGLVFSAGNAAELAKAVKTLWQDKARRAAMTSRAAAATTPYDWKNIVKKIDEQAITPHL